MSVNKLFVLQIAVNFIVPALSFEIVANLEYGVDEGYEFSNVILNSTDDQIVIKNYDHSVNSVTFVESNLYRIPAEIIHEGLAELKLDVTNITEIGRDDFTNATHLKVLQLGFNPIEVIKDLTFELTPNLQRLDLQSCELSEINENAFKGLSTLKKLNLENNKISELTPEVFAPLLELKNLNLHNNQLRTFRPNIFVHNIKLSELVISQNNLSALPPLDAQKKTLKSLNIYANELIEELDISSFEALNSLHAGSCRISNLTATNVRTLTFVDLSNNKLVDLSVLANNTDLWYINFSGNRIGQLGTMLQSFEKLQFLYLENTRIKSISENELAGVRQLKRFDISNSGLETLEFPKMKKLRELFLRGNKLTRLNVTKKVLPKLKEINVQDNFIKCLDLSRILRDLRGRKVKTPPSSLREPMSVALRKIGCVRESS